MVLLFFAKVVEALKAAAIRYFPIAELKFILEKNGAKFKLLGKIFCTFWTGNLHGKIVVRATRNS